MSSLKKILKYLLLTYIIILPWQTRYIFKPAFLNGNFWDPASLSFYASQIILILFIFFGFLFYFKTKDRQQEGLVKPKIFVWLGLSASLIVYLLVSLLFADNLMIAAYWLVIWILGFCLFFILIKTDFRFKEIGLAFVFSGFVQGALALWQFLEQKIYANKWLGLAAQDPSIGGVSVIELPTERWLRAYGGFPHPNFLAGFLAVCFLFLIGYLLLQKNNKVRLLGWLALPLILSGLFLAFSRSAWLGLVISLILLIYQFSFLKKKELKKFWTIIGIAFLWLLILAALFTKPFFVRFDPDQRLEQKSLAERQDYYRQSREILNKNWIFGVGLGNYSLAYHRLQPELAWWQYQPVHNVFVLGLAELGIAGFLFMILIYWEIFYFIYKFKVDKNFQIMEIFRQYKAKNLYFDYKENLYWFNILSAIILLVLVLSLFDHYFWTQYSGVVLFWLLFGLWVNQRKRLKE